MYARPQLSREGCWARSLVNLPNSFFHFLSKLKNFIVNLTIRLPFLKVTGTALSACWKKSELGEKKKKSAAKWSWVMDREVPSEPSTEQSGGCSWKCQPELLEAWMGEEE